MAKISGILTDGAGQIINDCTIELYAKKTTNKVLTQTQTFQVSENGKYSMNVLPCEYEVSLIINGFPKKRLGIINVYSDSADGTLNDYLINPEDSDLTPEFLKQIFDARNEAIKSAEDAKSWASTIDTTSFIKKTGEEKQSIDGVLTVGALSANEKINASEILEIGTRVYSPNNKPDADTVGALPATKSVVNGVPTYSVGDHVVFKDAIGDFRLMPFRANELPFGWYFRNGDNYLLHSPQGQVLNRLSDNYKRDHQITIKNINGQLYINVPSAFAPDGRGYFERAVNGTNRQVGSAEDDAIRNLYGEIHHIFHWKDTVPNGVFRKSRNDDGSGLNNRHYPVTCHVSDSDYPEQQVFFNASWFVPTAHENRPINMGMTPAIYLGV